MIACSHPLSEWTSCPAAAIGWALAASLAACRRAQCLTARFPLQSHPSWAPDLTIPCPRSVCCAQVGINNGTVTLLPQSNDAAIVIFPDLALCNAIGHVVTKVLVPSNL